MEESLAGILERGGGMNALARALGITSAAVAGWKRDVVQIGRAHV